VSCASPYSCSVAPSRCQHHRPRRPPQPLRLPFRPGSPRTSSRRPSRAPSPPTTSSRSTPETPHPTRSPSGCAIWSTSSRSSVRRPAARHPRWRPSSRASARAIVTLALQGKRLTLDAAKVAVCEADTRKQLEDCDRVLSPVSPLPVSCQGLFQGTLGAGGACRSDLECLSGLTCVGLGPTDPGKCSKPAPAGAPCHPVVDPLAVYTKQSLDEDHPSCTGACNRNQCADLLSPGAACVFDSQCGPKNRCSAKKCVAGRPALGSPCTSLGDCPLDATCANGVCAARGKTGATCTRDDQCLGECELSAGGGRCGPRCPHAFVPRVQPPAVAPATSRGAPARRPALPRVRAPRAAPGLPCVRWRRNRD
jgi:hypothetical protein